MGALANGANATLNITAKVDQEGDISNTANRTASSPTDNNAGNDSDSATVTGTTKSADITVTKTVNNSTPKPGENITVHFDPQESIQVFEA